MTSYFILKYVHILSAAVLLGTGAGIAYFLFTAHLSRDIEALRVVTRYVILADWIFTATAVVVQPVTGLWMALERGWPPTTPWIFWSLVLYVAIGACWIPVVVLQYRIARFVRDAASYAALGADYHRAIRCWVALGVPAFTMLLVIYALMVFKPAP
ncbi:MAG: DUF2269 domain-containing protein [Betaproteobacteria bacterium]|nr:DUF2269 domain-containing protein [Betaproteobacteria bacterium]